MERALRVELPRAGRARAEVVAAIRDSGLADWLSRSPGGPFGHTSATLSLLEALVEAGDLSLSAAEQLRGVILEELSGGRAAGFALPRLEPEHRQLLSSFLIVVAVDTLTRRVEALCPAPRVEGGLELEGLGELLCDEGQPVDLLRRVLRLSRAYAERQEAGEGCDDGEGSRRALEQILAFARLLRRAVIDLAHSSALRPLLRALEAREVSVAGYRYRGLLVEELRREPSGLLPVGVDDIVGNDDFLRAGLRLARDVSGYDFERRRNPKRFNPVLFGLGRPGCGKTVTAHAVGNYFLDYCRQREVAARFLVVRRTDWASSYQNASAANLVRFFREEVYGAEGVCGVYWPDIDTAFASRDSGQLRQEEKQNLGAVFGVFDGTLLPQDGKWFLICDANNLHMDEATISRIAQNPYRVEGPTRAEDYLRLMRGVLLRDVVAFLPGDEEAWLRLGRRAAELELSGRNINSICGNVRSHIQDFELPDEYFRADAAERDAIVSSLGRSVDEARLRAFLDDFADFQRGAEAEAERARFDGEVERIVRHLNASRVAAGRALVEGDL